MILGEKETMKDEKNINETMDKRVLSENDAKNVSGGDATISPDGRWHCKRCNSWSPLGRRCPCCGRTEWE